MNSLSDIVSQVMNKEEFVESVKKLGAPEEAIESEWKKIEDAFAVNYFYVVYSKFEENIQNELAEGLSLEDVGKDTSELIKRIANYIIKNPNAINVQESAKEAAVITQQNYLNVEAN